MSFTYYHGGTALIDGSFAQVSDIPEIQIILVSEAELAIKTFILIQEVRGFPRLSKCIGNWHSACSPHFIVLDLLSCSCQLKEKKNESLILSTIIHSLNMLLMTSTT